jgi:hypothetical protein
VLSSSTLRSFVRDLSSENQCGQYDREG